MKRSVSHTTGCFLSNYFLTQTLKYHFNFLLLFLLGKYPMIDYLYLLSWFFSREGQEVQFHLSPFLVVSRYDSGNPPSQSPFVYKCLMKNERFPFSIGKSLFLTACGVLGPLVWFVMVVSLFSDSTRGDTVFSFVGYSGYTIEVDLAQYLFVSLFRCSTLCGVFIQTYEGLTVTELSVFITLPPNSPTRSIFL